MDEGAKLHLKEWLIAQVESGKYEGLCWEDEEKTMFRIPWKHAAKKDYKQTEDAALFKAWAVYKGKYKEGRDKADPTMWKTRLRCALNKSTDFQEVPERNQLDITEPYKVYRVEHDVSLSKPAAQPKHAFSQVRLSPRSPGFPEKQIHCQNKPFQVLKEDKPCADDLMREHMYCEVTEKQNLNQPPPISFFGPSLNITDFRMQVKLVYHGQTVTNLTTQSPDGCFILQGHVPLGNEQIYGPCSAQQISFPSPGSVALPASLVEAMNRLLCHLERGVLLWVAPDGVFIKRFCQGRVYWSGPLAQHSDKPNKLEREKTCKLLDIPTFLNALQNSLQGKGPPPSYEIELCFGEEFPDQNVPKTRKLIIAHVVPLFAVELLRRLGQAEEKHQKATLSAEENMSED
ncbi:interferon regulatory factor 10 [Cyprinodon tularosa]|uniref:interferon regulatory factor 10 n=1 Tax=Cyprinodon tularosa TaxID=77115 RepID=UPI0018E1F81D|nr:interferon regulatory factor 10 [Cyprinodon tularosa]